MGLRGPKAIDPAIRKNRGTYRPSDHPAGGIVGGGGGKVTCPKWLSPLAKKEFRKILRELRLLGVVGTIDGNLLTRYVHTWAQWLAAQVELDKAGIVTATLDSRGRKRKGTQSPWLLVSAKLADQLLKMETLMGMSPMSRQRLQTAPAEQTPDAGEQFFGPEQTPPLKIGGG